MSDSRTACYVGRFAPSPTGPLHFGSAVAAIASFLEARSNHGHWLVRIEDLDPPREQPGADKLILDTITALGMHWDGCVVYQSNQHAHYRQALDALAQQKRLYDCGCSKREIGSGAYPGTCRAGLPPGKVPRSLRFLVPTTKVSFFDATFGEQNELLGESVGDFNVRRADGLYAYHLAVVVDDFLQGVTDVVRGVDLLSSTARQIALQQALGYPQPRYLHIPLVCDKDGNKLSKQHGAKPIDAERPGEVWFEALRFLNQHPPAFVRGLALDEIINWAIEHWRPASLAQQHSHL